MRPTCRSSLWQDIEPRTAPDAVSSLPECVWMHEKTDCVGSPPPPALWGIPQPPFKENPFCVHCNALRYIAPFPQLSTQREKVFYPLFKAGHASHDGPDWNLLRVRSLHVPALLPALPLHYKVTGSYYMPLLGILIGFSHQDFFEPSELQSLCCEYKITQWTLANICTSGVTASDLNE